jgi:bifunctional UDP-N-acetylglucosamine pyrophosphorylase/glucosamine-1-phosphate N-acetyltransferase
MKDDIAAVILAAGLGKRMKSDLPKVLHQADGRYLVDYVIDNIRQAGISRIILVIGHKFELVRKSLAGRGLQFVVQKPQLGTGHALQIAAPELGDFDGDLVVLAGDMPLISPDTIMALAEKRRQAGAAAAVLTVILDDPGSYGRIVRDGEGYLKAIVEYRDADHEIRQIQEINTAAYCFDFRRLVPILARLKPDNDQAEYYLTDTIALLRQAGLKVTAFKSDNPNEGLGVNSLAELAIMEKLIKEQSSRDSGKINKKIDRTGRKL